MVRISGSAAFHYKSRMLSDAQRRDYLARAQAAARRGESANLTADEEADLFERAGFQRVGDRQFIGEIASRRVVLE